MKKLSILVLISFTLGCNQPTKQNVDKDIPKPVIYITPSGDKIVFLEDYYRAYLKTIKTNYANRDNIYQKNIKDSIFDKYFTKSEYSELIKNRFSSPIRDTAKLSNYIDEIKNNHEKIEQLIVSALAECNKYLKNDSITIYILPCNRDMENIVQLMGGVSGVTAGSKQIVLTVDPEVSTCPDMLSYCVSHEFNHTYWIKINFSKSNQFTLLDYLVFEGRADSYAHFIYPTVICPWTKTLTKDSEDELWDKIKTQLNNTDMAFQYSVMFGMRSQYPIWGGYTLGYHIVQSALKNYPELAPRDWATFPSMRILEMSDYK